VGGGNSSSKFRIIEQRLSACTESKCGQMPASRIKFNPNSMQGAEQRGSGSKGTLIKCSSNDTDSFGTGWIAPLSNRRASRHAW
jgi:hypothetical protein